MIHVFKSRKNWIMIAIITALVLAMGCVFAACTKAQAESTDYSSAFAMNFSADITDIDNTADGDDTSAQNYSHWLSDNYSAGVYTREMWLADILTTLELTADDLTDSDAVFTASYDNGIIDSINAEPYLPLTRSFVAQTLVRALHYKNMKFEFAADLASDDKDMESAAYYGWFIPDDDGLLYPDALITGDEYQQLTDEVRCWQQLHGKKVLSFGDSIMYGMGNSDKGISDMVGEKYGMTVSDYSISGATFGICSDRSHISDQIRAAAKTKAKPDVILINGGTNDMRYVKHGTVTDGFDIKKTDEKTFAGGFENAAALLKKYWPDVPVIYIRAHDMDNTKDDTERKYGETALSIAQKWGFECVDIFSDTGLNTERADMRDAYTLFKDNLGHSDGVHPNALGYAKYYLPNVSATLIGIFG